MDGQGLGARFWRLFASSGASNLADGIALGAVPLLATTLTRDPVLISALTGFAFLPWLLFALPAGTFVDRSDRRRVMIGANLFRVAAFGTLAGVVLAGAATIWVLFAVVFAVGVAETLYDSAARALLPQVVDRDRLDRGNSLLATVETGGQTFVGGPAGSLLFALAAAAPLATNAGAYALAALLMVTVTGTYRPATATDGRFTSQLRDGVRWLLRHRFLRVFTVINGLSSALQSMATAVVVLYALDVLDVPVAGYGLVAVAAGVGGLLGGLAAPALSRRLSRTGALSATAVLFPIPVFGMSLTTNAVVGCSLFGLTAFLVMAWNVLSMSLRQILIPEHLFGRVQGSYRTLVWGGIPVGALAGGLVATATSVPMVFAVSGAGNLLAGVWMAALLRRHRAEIAAAYGKAPESRDSGASS